MRKLTLSILFLIFLCQTARPEEQIDFLYVDTTTYKLYQEGKWKEVTTLSNAAYKAGIDYFYLRLRCGLAYYFLGNYMQAETNLEHALEFSSTDKTAREYLYYSYLMQKKGSKAVGLLKKMPPSMRERLKEEAPPNQSFLHFDAGYFIGDNSVKNSRNYNLDGSDNIYGETVIPNESTYLSVGGKWFMASFLSAYVKYTYLKVNKNMLVMTGDTLMIDYPAVTSQDQFYINFTVYPGGGFKIVPAFHYLKYRVSTISPYFDNQSGTYQFPEVQFSDNNYIGFLGIEKDFNILNTGVFGAMANLNGFQQYQAGFNAIVFPTGNLDLYLQLQYVAHFNDSELQPVINAMLGAKILKPVWLELSGSFGEVQNYFEDNASAVYNFPDKILYRYGLKLISPLSKRVQLTIDYQYLGQESPVLYYVENNSNSQVVYEPRVRFRNYNQHLIIGSLLWKF